MVVRWLLCFVMLCMSTTLMAQHRITGSVLDEADAPIIGATVVIKGSVQGTTTDVNGNFTLTVPEAGATLTVTYVGYTPVEVAVTAAEQQVNVKLFPDTISVDEVVVVGYGEQARRSVTSSIANLKGEPSRTSLSRV